MPVPATDVIPSFVLYGESPNGDLPDLIHIEALKDRSQHHGWEIKPHRHLGLMQIMHFRTANVQLHLDGVTRHTDLPSILVVPPTVIHGFRFSPDVVGNVTTVPLALIEESGQTSREPLQQTVLISEDHACFAHLAQLLDQVEDEYDSQRSDREQVLQSLIRLISLWIERSRQDLRGDEAVATVPYPAERRVRSFLNLVDQHYLNCWETAAYGKIIGVSKSQLTRDCRSVLEKSPLQVIHDRIIKEANRKLAYTAWSVTNISEWLGFTDLGYFSRFYRKKTGETPTNYRMRLRTRMRMQSSGNHAHTARNARRLAPKAD